MFMDYDPCEDSYEGKCIINHSEDDTEEMTDEKAIKTVQDRMDLLLCSPDVQVKMVRLHQVGKTTEEIRKWLTDAAIYSLIK